MEDKILMYEELSLNAHPAIQTQHFDGWILRFADGYTKRANSVSPLYASTKNPTNKGVRSALSQSGNSELALHEKIFECENRYFTLGLPAIFKLTDNSDPNIDETLKRQGYTLVEPTYVMEMDMKNRDFPLGDCIMTNCADELWLNSYFVLSKNSDKKKMAAAKQILTNVKTNMICGRIIKDGISIACGTAVIERGYMGLLNVIVDEQHRGKGYGIEICESLLSASKRIGAHTAYLQVVQENHTAVNLYKKLGYQTIYTYWYWVKKGDCDG